jgi:O-antigen ligase
LDPNFLGAGLVFALLFTLAQKTGERQALSSLEKQSALALISVAVLLTFSRSAYLIAALALVLYALLRRSFKLFLILTTFAICAFLLYTVPRAQIETSRNIDRSLSADLRLKSYGQTIKLFQEHPLTGIGYNLTRYEKNQHHMILDTVEGGNSGAGSDSSWLLILSTTGLLGFLIFLSFWIKMAYFAVNISDNKSPEHSHRPFSWLPYFLRHASPLQSATIALFLAWSIHSNLINSLFYPYLLISWGIIFSLTYTQSLDTKNSKL